MTRAARFVLAALVALAATPAAAQAPAPFEVELADALNADRGGPVRARPVNAPAAAGFAQGDILSGDARVERLPDGVRRVTIRWTAVRSARGTGRAFQPAAESAFRTPDQAIPPGTRLRVAWAPGRGLDGRLPDLPDGPNAEQLAVLKRAREAGRLGPPGTGRVITLDMLLGDKPGSLAPGR